MLIVGVRGINGINYERSEIIKNYTDLSNDEIAEWYFSEVFNRIISPFFSYQMNINYSEFLNEAELEDWARENTIIHINGNRIHL